MNSQHKYERTIVEDIEESLSKIAEKIEPNSVVLDIGCSSGMLGKYIVANKGCIVDGVDIDAESIKKCQPAYRKVVIKNLDKDELTSSFIEQSYDYIVVADVIEHLYDASNLLSQLRLLVKPTGTIIFSVPNVAHIASVLEMLNGNFNYRDNGLLDSTHIRFFSFDGLVKTLEASGLYLHDADSVKKDVNETEYGDAQTSKFPKQWLDALVAARPEALAYQWILSTKIYPSIGVNKTPKSAGKKSPLFTTALYWTSNLHPSFSEENKMIALAHRRASNDFVATMKFELQDEEKVADIRFDPISEPKTIWIKEVCIKNKDHQIVWKWNEELNNELLVGASWLSAKANQGGLFYSTTYDPNWHIKLNREIAASIDDGSYLEVVFSEDSAQIDAFIVNAAKQETAKLEAQIQQLSDDLSQERGQSIQLREQVTQLQGQISSLNDHLHHVEASLKQIEEERKAAQNELVQVQNELAQVYRSTSWRVTAPIRKVLNALRGGPRP
ncbi:MAG: methyltransferase domain-containing protein [Burkholderiales bacterium]|nr:methyltransferase domain-containing protein [Burkholderiales bacterium]